MLSQFFNANEIKRMKFIVINKIFSYYVKILFLKNLIQYNYRKNCTEPSTA